MKPEDLVVFRSLFKQALERPGSERRAFVERECRDRPELQAKLEELLVAHDEAGDFLVSALDDSPPVERASLQGGVEPARIDRYRLLELLGQGGMGEVWLAEQREPVRRQVAVKIIKLGMDTRDVIARFELERQALALMDHPYIAKVFDGGATESGRPFFAMELVRGIPITKFCDQTRRSIQDRILLFKQVCEAIQHAHLKGIIHRDLKPSNILIAQLDGKPVPKVIDFGIAKATHKRLTEETLLTNYRQLLGTPDYMSPEQAEIGGMDVDTRTDVYSLGVLFYELLTGSHPFRGADWPSSSFDQKLQTIREVDPERPSTRIDCLGEIAPEIAKNRGSSQALLARTVRGDLDWIVIRALEKDRTRRYETVSALAADLDHYLAEEPVHASPPGAGYRLAKFVRRHKLRVIGAATALVLVLVALSALSYGFLRVRSERDRAVEAEISLRAETVRVNQLREKAEAFGDVLKILLAPPNPATLRKGLLTPVEVFKVWAERIDLMDFDQQGDVEAQVRHLIGMLFSQFGERDLAIENLNAAYSVRKTLFGELNRLTLESAHQLGTAYLNFGEYNQAELYLRKTLRGRRATLSGDNVDTLVTMGHLGSLLNETGRFGESEQVQREAVVRLEQTAGPDDQRTLMAMHNLGMILKKRGMLVEAESFIRKAFEGQQRVLDDRHPDTLLSMLSLASLLRLGHRYLDAEPLLLHAVQACRETLGDSNSRTLGAMHGLAVLWHEMDRFEQAEELMREVLAGRMRRQGEQHLDTILVAQNLGRMLIDSNQLDEAEQLLRRALELCDNAPGAAREMTLVVQGNLGRLARRRERPEEAEGLFREAFEGFRRFKGPAHEDTVTNLKSLAFVLRDLDREEEAVGLFADNLALCEDSLPADNPNLLELLDEFGWFLHFYAHRSIAGEVLLRRALAGRRAVLSNESDVTVVSMNRLASLCQDTGRTTEAERLLREALEIRRRTLGEQSRSTLISINNLGFLLRKLGSLEESERLLYEAFRGFEQILGQTGSASSVRTAAENHARAAGQLAESRRQQLGATHAETVKAWLRRSESLALLDSDRAIDELRELRGVLEGADETGAELVTQVQDRLIQLERSSSGD